MLVVYMIINHPHHQPTGVGKNTAHFSRIFDPRPCLSPSKRRTPDSHAAALMAALAVITSDFMPCCRHCLRVEDPLDPRSKSYSCST